MRPMAKHPAAMARSADPASAMRIERPARDPIAVQLKRLNVRNAAAIACHTTTWSGSREGSTARLTTKSQRATEDVAQAARPRSQARPGAGRSDVCDIGSPETGDCQTDRAPLCTIGDGLLTVLRRRREIVRGQPQEARTEGDHDHRRQRIAEYRL